MCVNTRRRISFFWLGHRRARAPTRVAASAARSRSRSASAGRTRAGNGSAAAAGGSVSSSGGGISSWADAGRRCGGSRGTPWSGSSAAPGRRRDYVRRRSRCRPTACPTRSAARGAGRGLKLRRVLAGALADVGRQEQMAGRLQHRSQLGPGQAAATLALPPDEVAAAVPALVAGGVNGGPRLGRDQAAILRRADGLAEEGIDPFFSRRRPAAFWRVE